LSPGSSLIACSMIRRSARIVGSKGATIQRLRAESGADIIVGNNGSDMIEIVGGTSPF
jgi:rRNA processing protein Krr1/Pno1